MSWDLICDVLKNSYLITSIVIVMMIMIEYINVASAGKWLGKLKQSRWRQIVSGACLGLVPGCIGGFAAVSLYSHGTLSLGALVAAMISSSGDESFVMLALIPKYALMLFALLFVIAVACGFLVDLFWKGRRPEMSPDHDFEVHDEYGEQLPDLFRLSSYSVLKHPGKERIIIMGGIIIFAVLVFTGVLEHDHVHGPEARHLELFSERWINLLFACASLAVLFFVASSKEHFIKEHIWNHVLKKHLAGIFLWTVGALLLISLLLAHFDIEPWLKENAYYVLLLAAVVGMIPESGPHLVFVTLFAGGMVPFSVLLTSSMSQDGHTSLPLLASNRRSFVYAKLVNALFAVAVGSLFYLFGL